MCALGEWVEFQFVVGKQATNDGSMPISQRLGRTRKGMIVGVRNVYDVSGATQTAPGISAPPQLANPRPVLIVAVSLHRSYRVYPQDAQLCQPPQPRKQRQAAAAPAAAFGQKGPAAAPIALIQPGGDADDLARISQSDLEQLVADQLTRWIASGEFFTAYDVTVALRTANPTVRIDHAEVRPLVHSQMEAAVVSGIYERESATFGPNSATRYLPMDDAA